MSVASRPRLSEDVVLRQHYADGEAWATLQRREDGVMIRLGPREAAVLLAADGTRDAEGIALAVSRRGVKTSAGEVQALFTQLRAGGLVVDGPPAYDPEAAAIVERPTDLPGDRVVLAAPGFRYVCDGQGGCCSQYGAVLLSPSDRARALAACEGESIGPWPIEHAFVPQHGSAPAPVRVATLVDGGCMFLDPDSKCRVHRKAGLAAKPAGCQLFPLRLVDDGEAVRASAVTECRCVLADAPAEAAPLVEDGTTAGDLPGIAVVRRLPDVVPIDADRTWSRGEVRRWSIQAHEDALSAEDPAAWCWDEAHRIDGRWPAKERPLVTLSFAALLEETRDLVKELEFGRPDAAALVRGLKWMALACGLLADVEMLASLIDEPPTQPDLERRYLGLAIWGFVGLGKDSLPTWLRDRAARLWLARAMESARGPHESHPSLDIPLTVVDAMMRGYGLSTYRELF